MHHQYPGANLCGVASLWLLCINWRLHGKSDLLLTVNFELSAVRLDRLKTAWKRSGKMYSTNTFRCDLGTSFTFFKHSVRQAMAAHTILELASLKKCTTDGTTRVRILSDFRCPHIFSISLFNQNSLLRHGIHRSFR